MENNGNILIKGADLTRDQKAMLQFKGMSNPEFVIANAFWFKDGKPSTEEGYFYPVTKSLSKYLPY
jgi:hypothetical protein